MPNDFLDKKIDGEIDETKHFDLNDFQKEIEMEEFAQSLNRPVVEEEASNATDQEEIPSRTKEILFDLEAEKMKEKELALNREIRRQYIHEKQREEELAEKPYHRYPSYFYTGFWLRFFAYLVDLVVVGIIGVILVDPIFSAFQLEKSTVPYSPYALAHLAVFLLYFILMTKLSNGQTIGKMIFGIRVVCFREENLSWATVIVREGFGRYLMQVWFFMYGLYLILFFNERKQQAADLFCDTSVVTENLVKASHVTVAN